ncbi:TPA: 50S ribosomal protein L33 [Candidatus Peregrinibacteria bacterium]|nr:50S ribosomal protein L33 [Candidatus Peregrinibacteria bacterium]
MARGKSTFCTWYCSECNKAGYISTYNKKSNEKIKKTKKKYCAKCRKSMDHKRKDTKS